MRRLLLGSVLAAAVLVSSCAEPPNKEMDQAQGAIDAASAAGAERYAPTEYAAATTALKQANDAVTAGDYRLALNYALASREHAQNAARNAADTRARIRGEVERAMAEASALLTQAKAQVTANRARVPRRTLREAQQALARAEDDVQKARAAMKADDYDAAQPVLQGLKERIEKVLAAIDAAATQSTRRAR